MQSIYHCPMLILPVQWYSVTTAGGTSAAFTAAMHTALQSAGTLGSVPSESLQPLNDVIIGIGSYLHDKATAYRAARRSRSKKSQAIPSSDTPATFGGPSLTVPSNAHWRGTEEEGSRDCLVPSKLRPLFLQVLDSYSPSSFSQVQGGDDGRDESDDVDDTAEGPDTANPCCDFDIGQSQSQGTNSPEFFTPHPATASSVAASDREFDTRSGNMAKPREEDRSPVTSFQPTDFALRGLDDSSAVGGFSFGRPRETETIGVRTPPHLPRVDQDDPTGRSAATSLYPEDQLPEAPLSPEGLRPANTSADSYFPVFLP